MKPKILLAESYPMLADGLSLFLKEEYEVFLYESYKAAIDALPSIQPEVLCLHFRSGEEDPIQSGLELIKRAKARYPKLPIIVTTGGRDEHIVKAMKAGATNYCRMPFDTSDLIEALERASRGEVDPIPELKGQKRSRGRNAAPTKRRRRDTPTGVASPPRT